MNCSPYLARPLRTLAQALADRQRRREIEAQAKAEAERRRKLLRVAICNAAPRSALD